MLDIEALIKDSPQTSAFLKSGDRIAMQFFLRMLTKTAPENPEHWHPFNPIHLAQNHSQRRLLLLTGGEDRIVPHSHSEPFADALTASGHDVSLETILQSDHLAMTDPQRVGRAILRFLTVNQ